MKRTVFLTFVFSGLMILSSSAYLVAAAPGQLNAGAAATSSSSGTITVGWSGTGINTLNPFTTYSALGRWIGSNIYLPLVYYDAANQTVTPALASSWHINLSNHTAIFDLNPNAVWSDGTPVTSQDVVYSYLLATQNYSVLEQYVTSVSNVTAITPHSVKFTMTSVLWTTWAAYVAIVPYHIWRYVDATTYPAYNSTGSQYFVGDGPYLLNNYVVNQYTEIQKNPKEFLAGHMAAVDKVIFEFFSSESSAITSLQSGSIQGLTGILPSDISQFQNNSKYVITTSPGLEYFYLSINVNPQGNGNPTLRNLTVRQAMAHAINLKYIAKTAFHGYASVLNSVLTPTNQYYDRNLSAYSYNVSLADEMLNQSGFPMTSSGYRVNASNTSQHLTYAVLVPSGDTLEVDAANMIAQNLSAIGIQLTVTAETTGSMVATIWPHYTQDMDLWDWFDYTQNSPYRLLGMFLPNQIAAGNSDSGFSNSTYQQVWNELANATSLSQVSNLSDQLQQILHQQLPYIPLFIPSAITVYSSQISNLTPYPGGQFGGYDYLTFTQMHYSTSSPGSSNSTDYYIIGGVVAVIVVAAAAVLLTRRRRSE